MEQQATVYNRKEKRMQTVPVVADRSMRLLYTTGMGRATLWLLIKRKWVSEAYARYAKSRRSKRAADGIVETYGLDMSAFPPYQTYEQFFTRALPSVSMPQDPLLGACAQCFLTAFEHIDTQLMFALKGETITLSEILDDAPLSERYQGGTLLRFRLAPHHYHHLHHFDEATIVSCKDIKGDYYSVNPLALANIARLYARNRRRTVVMDTRHFGKVVLVEIGASMIGSIVNTFTPGSEVTRGEDGGYFKPGGSMLLLVFEQGRLVIDEDIRQHSLNGVETMVDIGEPIGKRGM